MTVQGERVLKLVAVVMFVAIIAAMTESVWAAKGGKPEPGPVTDTNSHLGGHCATDLFSGPVIRLL